jgi:hypothetical protein
VFSYLPAANEKRCKFCRRLGVVGGLAMGLGDRVVRRRGDTNDWRFAVAKSRRFVEGLGGAVGGQPTGVPKSGRDRGIRTAGTGRTRTDMKATARRHRRRTLCCLCAPDSSSRGGRTRGCGHHGPTGGTEYTTSPLISHQRSAISDQPSAISHHPSGHGRRGQCPRRSVASDGSAMADRCHRCVASLRGSATDRRPWVAAPGLSV